MSRLKLLVTAGGACVYFKSGFKSKLLRVAQGRIIALCCLLGTQLAAPSAKGQDLEEESRLGAKSAAGDNGQVAEPVVLDSLVWEELGALRHRSYWRRELAKQRLLGYGSQSIKGLETLLDSPHLEGRLAARELLDNLKNLERERELTKLLGGEDGRPQPNLPGWSAFATAAGDSRESRELFARVFRQHADALDWLDRLGGDSSSPGESAYLQMDSYLPIDIGRMNSGDPIRWTLLLLASQHPELVNAPILSSRIRGGLLNPQVSVRLKTCANSATLKRLIASWLRETGRTFVNSTILRISLIYECNAQAKEMTQLLLSEQGSPPAAVATSLMILARIDPQAARLECRRRIQDQRVCHVWQAIAVRHRAVQTEVRDVAIAMLLYLDGHDPRSFGFEDIEGDPETIYRDFSMGFEDDDARNRAISVSLKVLDGAEQSPQGSAE